MLELQASGRWPRRIGYAVLAYGAFDVARFFATGGNVSEGGTPHGTLTGKILGYRHVLGFGARNIHRPDWLLHAYRAESEARTREADLFWDGKRIGYDDGPDAFRHAFGSALISYLLVTEAGATPAAAAQFVREAGIAHEEDSFLTGPHYANRRAMDLHNNEVGIDVGLAVARTHGAGARDALEAAILAAIAQGRTVVLDEKQSPPRPSDESDLARLDG